MASVHDNLYQDDPNTKILKNMEEDQTTPNVETVPTEEKDQPTIVEENQAQPIIHDSSSNTSLGQEETLAIERKNPTESLRRLQKLLSLSIGSRSSHFSDASLADVGEGSMNLLMQQLKANIFLNAIKKDTQIGFEIQNLLVELNKLRVPDSMVQFLFEFEAYFDQVCRDIKLNKTYNNRFERTKEAMVVAWDLSGAFGKEVIRLENQIQGYLDRKALLDTYVADCQAQIAELTKEIDNQERKKAELAWEKSMPT